MMHSFLRHRQRMCIRLKRSIATVTLASLCLNMIGATPFSILNAPLSIPKAEAATGIFPAINYQGRITGINGTSVANGKYNVRFKIYTASIGGSPVWSETWDSTTQQITMTGGLFSVPLGTHVTMTGSVNFNTDNIYLQIEFDDDNNNTYTEIFSPRRRFGSVPYAHNANMLDGLDSTKFVRKDQPETLSGTLTIKPNVSSVLALKAIGTISGTSIHADLGLSASGNIIAEGAISGSSLYAGTSIRGGGLTDCDAASSRLLWDATTGRFSCGTISPSFSTGNVLTIGNAKYVSKQGDTMTGTLVISIQGGSLGSIGLRVLNTLSGAIIHAEKELTSSGALMVKQTGTVRGSGALTVVNTTTTGTGAYMSANDAILALNSTSNTVAASKHILFGYKGTFDTTLWRSAANVLSTNGTFSGASLYADNTIRGAGLTDCDDGVASKLLWDATSGRFSCGTDQSGSSGLSQAAGDARYVKKSGDTMTGVLVIQNGNTHSPTGTALLNVRGTISGTTLYANTAVRSSGSITAEGAISGSSLYAGTSIRGAGLSDCDTASSKLLWDATSGRFSCGTISASFSTGNVLTIGNTKYVSKQGDTMTGALVINIQGGTLGSIGLRVLNTFSGAIIHAEKALTSSGTLMVKQTGTVRGSGALTVVNTTTNGTGAYMASNGAILALDATNAASRHILFGYDANFDTALWRSGAATLSTNGTFSGVTLYAASALRSSGSITAEGAISGSSLYAGTSISGAGLSDCDTSATSKLMWDATTGRFSCGTDTAGGSFSTGNVLTIGNAKYVSKQGDTMTGALVINIQGGTMNTVGLNVMNTISGAIIHAEKSLTSSGTLAVEGAATVGGMLHVLQSNGEVRLDTGGAGNTFTLSFYDGSQRATISNNQATATFSIGTENRLLIDSSDYIAISAPNYVNLNNFATFNTTNVGFGTSSPDTELEVIGTISGSTVYAANALRSSGSITAEGAISGSSLYAGTSIRGAGLSDCDTSATSKLLWDATTGRFSCGTDQAGGSFSSGNVLTIGNAKYVSKQGDTMTGALVINMQGGSLGSIGLRVLNTFSGAIIHAEKELTSSGTLMVKQTGTVRGSGALTVVNTTTNGTGAYMASNGAILALDATNTASRHILFGYRGTFDTTLWRSAANVLSTNGTFSGVTLYATNAVRSSGSITAEGAISGSSLYAGTSIRGAGLSDCDTSATSKLMWDATTGRFSCGTTSGGLSSGNVLTLGDGRYVRTAGGTMTGALVVQNGNTHTPTGTALINVRGTISGTTLYANTAVRSSGSITAEGAISGSSLYAGTSIRGAGLSDCDTSATSKLMWDATTGRFSCGTDTAGGSFSSGNVLTIGNAKYVSKQGDTMTGALVINMQGGSLGSIGLRVLNTFSGAIIHAEKALTSSGTLMVKQTGTVRGSGALTVVNTTRNGTGAFISASGSVLVLNSTSARADKAQHILFGYQGTFDVSLSRTAANILSLTGSLLPGSTNRYDLGSSTMRWRDLYLSGSSLHIGANGNEATVGYNTAGSYFTVGTSSQANAFTILNSNGFVGIGTNNADTKLEVIGTISGSTVYAANALRSSGSITAEGAISGSSLYAGTSIRGAGLSDCDTSATSKLMWDATTGRFSCGTDQAGGSFSTGNVLTIGNAKYVSKQGDTMTGALNIRLATTTNVGLNVAGTMSGRSLQVTGTGSSPLLKTDVTTGRVGINTASPEYTLDIAATAPSLRLLKAGTSSGAILLRSANTLTLTNLVSTPAGPVSALNFNGTDYLSASSTVSALSSATQFTISGWFKRNVVSNYCVINQSANPTSNGRTALGHWSDGSLYFVVEASGQNSYGGYALNDTNWHHIVAVYDGSQSTNATKAVVYVDGVAQTLSFTGTIPTTSNNTSAGILTMNPAQIGGFNYGQCSMDDIRIYNRTISAGEVGQIYNSGNGTTGGPTSGLAGWWKLDEGAGITTADASGNGNTLTLVSSPTWEAGKAQSVVTLQTATILSSNDGVSPGENGIAKFGDATGGTWLQGQSLKFYTNSLERARFSTGGQLGLGTTTPGSTLSVSGSVLINKKGTTNATAKTGLALEVIGGMSGSFLSVSRNLNVTGAILSVGNIATRGTLSGAALTVMSGNSYLLGNVMIGSSANADTKLEVVGTISGSTVYAANALRSSGSITAEGAISGSSLYAGTSIQGAGLTDCDTGATSKLLWDATTGRFSCGTDQTGTSSPFSTGNVLTIGNAKYVSKQGDTMTGALTINMQGGTLGTIGLKVLNTLSGAIIHAEKELTSSGTLMVKQTGTSRGSGALTVVNTTTNGTGAYMASNGAILALDATNAASRHILFGYDANFDTALWRSGAATLSTNGTFSGVTLYATNAVRSSGSITAEGAISGSSLYAGTSIRGAGLSDCDTSATSKLLWDATTGRFSCGTDQSGGSFSSGNVLTIGNAKYVSKQGDTMTGALVINIQGGSLGSIGLRVLNTFSGAIIHAEKELTSSGTLMVKQTGTVRGSGALTVVNTTTTGTGAYMSANDAILALNSTSNTVAASKHILFGYKGTFDTTLWRSAATVLSTNGTFSGASLYADNTIRGAGLSDCDNASTSKLLWDATSGRFSCGTDQTGGGGGFSTGNVLTIGSAKYVSKQGDTMTGALVINMQGGTVNTIGLRVINTLSGAILQATKELRSSGSLAVESGSYLGGDIRFDLARNHTIAVDRTTAFALGKNLTVSAGDALSFAGGNLVLQGGSQHTGRATISLNGTGDLGGDITIDAGDAGTSVEQGGNLSLSAGNGGNNPGFVSITGGNNTVFGVGGSVHIYGGRGSSSYQSGSVILGMTPEGKVAGNVGIRTLNPTEALEVGGTVSGSTLYAANALRSSGSITAEGAISGSSLFAGTSIRGAGLTDCDTGATSKLLWDATSGRFSCGTDQTGGGGSSFSTGNVLTIGSANYVSKQGDTMTGALQVPEIRGNDATAINTRGTNLVVAGGRAQGSASGGDILFKTAPINTASAAVAANFVAANTEYLSIGDNADLSFGDEDFSIAGWVYFNSLTGGGSFGTIVGKYNTGANEREYSVYLPSGTNKLRFVVTNNGSVANGILDSTVSVTTGTWYFVYAEHDSVNNELVLKVNANTADTLSYSLGGRDGASTFALGNMVGLSSAQLDGRLDEIAIYNRVLTSTELTYLYNGGAGRVYGGIGIPATDGSDLTTSLISWWDLDETSGNRADSHGANTLTDNNTVTSAAGNVSASSSDLNTLVSRMVITSSGAVGIGTITPGSTLAVSGATIINGRGTTNTRAKAGLALEVIGTISGSTVYAASALRSSGSITAEGTISGASLYIGGSMRGAGLVSDCDTASTSKLLWDSTTGRFSCGTDYSSSFSTGNVLTLGGARYVELKGDSMTGSLQTPSVNLSGVLLTSLNGHNQVLNLNNAGLATYGVTRMSADGNLNNIGSIKSGEIHATTNASFGTAVTYTVGSGPRGSAIGDLNGDGRGDVVVTNASTTTISVLLNTGSGKLAAKTDYTVGNFPYVVVIGDLNGDGKQDLATANSGGNTMSVLLNTGSGKFATHTTYATGTAPRGLVIADFNRDGKPDLVTANYSSNTISVFINKGNGTFATKADYAAGSGPFGMTTGDYNGDGHADVAVANSSTTTMSVLMNDGDGTFGTKVDYITGTTPLNPTTADFDGDGKADLAVVNNGSTTVSVFINSGTGSFRPKVDYATGAGPNTVTSGDLNGDGKPDMAVSNFSTTTVSIYINNGNGTFATQVPYTAGSNPLVVSMADMNGDGKADLVMPLWSNSAVAVLFNRTSTLLYASAGTGGYVSIGTPHMKAKLTVSNTNNGVMTGAYIYSSGAVLALDARTLSGAKTPHLLFGYRGNFDTRITRTAVGSLTFASQTGALVTLDTERSDATGNVFQIISDATTSYGGPDENKVFRIQANGAVFTDGAVTSNGADYAEWFYSGNEKLKSGEVVCIDITKNNAVKRCVNEADSNVMGIVSTNPAFIGNGITGADGIIPPGYALIGLIGQVPTKVIVSGTGSIRPGDALTPASTPGYARKAMPGESTVGVALEGIESGEGVINVLISRRNSSMTVDAVGQKVLDTIASMKIGDEVQLMVASSLENLNVDAQIQEEVQKQVSTIKSYDADIQTLQAELDDLKNQLALIRAQTGSTTIVTTGSSSALATDLTAATLVLEQTLATGGDARIGGDLHIDGTLMASSLFVPNGLSIDGGATITGTLAATTIHSTSGATIDGTLTVNGDIRISSGSLLFDSGATLSLGDLIVERSLLILGDITIDGLARFFGNVIIHGELILSNKQAGFALIPKSGTSVTVLFGSGGLSGIPVVTASPDTPVLYGVKHATQSGFTINLAGPAAEDTRFSWIAMVTENALTQTGTVIRDTSTIFPMGSDNIPVSSSMYWNACIRNTAIIDADGKPHSCSRYHTDYTWTHPDLLIEFLWNTNITPPLLHLPEGYTVEVTEDADSIRGAFTFGTNEAEPITSEETEGVIEETPVEPIEEDTTPKEVPAETPASEDIPPEEPATETVPTDTVPTDASASDTSSESSPDELTINPVVTEPEPATEVITPAEPQPEPVSEPATEVIAPSESAVTEPTPEPAITE